MHISSKDKLMKDAFKRLLFIQILSSLAALLGPMIDGIIVSNFLGADYMAAFGLVTPITVFVSAVGNIFHAGSQNISGKYLGQGKVSKLNQLMTSTILWGATAGLVITVGIYVFSEPLLTLLGAEGETLAYTSDYVRTFAIGIIPMILTPSLVGFLQLDGGGRTAVVSSAALMVSDIILDLMAVFVFKNGMFGIGLATAGSCLLSLLILFSHFLKKKTTLKFMREDSLSKELKKIVILGLPAATFLLCNVVRVAITNHIILDVSDLDSVAAFSIQNTFRPLMMAFTLGTGITGLLVCSVIAGEENRHAMRKELGYILKLGLIISAILGVVVFALAKYPLALLFCGGEEEPFQNMVAETLRLFALSIPFSMVNIILTNYYQSMRKILRATVISILQNVVYFIAPMKLLSKVMGVDAVWMGYLISETLTILTIFVMTWVKNRHFPKTIHDFLLLPEDFGATAENRMNITVTTKEEATGIAEKIEAFCKSKGMDKKRSMAAALCMEELAVIAIENSHVPKTYVDIYLVFQDGELKMRIRDNSRPFDKKLLAGTADSDDPCAHVGVRIVKQLAKDVKYHVVLGMNSYSIQI